MKVNEGEAIPGLEDAETFGSDGPTDKTVSEICEERLDELYENSWVSDLFRQVDATSIAEDDENSNDGLNSYYNSGAGIVEFDKFARGADLTDGWDAWWLGRIVDSIEDEALANIRDRCYVINNEEMTEEDTTEHFKEEYGFDNVERFRVGQNIYLYASPDMFGYDVVRRDFTVEHRYNLSSPYTSNYAIGFTRRGFQINGSAVLYDLRNEMQRKDPEEFESA